LLEGRGGGKWDELFLFECALGWFIEGIGDLFDLVKWDWGKILDTEIWEAKKGQFFIGVSFFE
jgi:hypothetical protein